MIQDRLRDREHRFLVQPARRPLVTLSAPRAVWAPAVPRSQQERAWVCLGFATDSLWSLHMQEGNQAIARLTGVSWGSHGGCCDGARKTEALAGLLGKGQELCRCL